MEAIIIKPKDKNELDFFLNSPKGSVLVLKHTMKCKMSSS